MDAPDMNCGAMKIERRPRLFSAWALLLGVLTLGCARHQLVATPNLFLRDDYKQVFAECPPSAQGPTMDVIYATDRALAEQVDGPVYGVGRARTLTFGTALVTLDPTPSWKELEQDSTRPQRTRDYALMAAGCKELGVIDPRWDKKHDKQEVQLASASRSEQDVQRENLHKLVRSRLAHTPRKDAYVFIHGFNNTFEDAIFRAAQVWHFLGRVGVPVAYTWPAGYGGLRGYAYDRESGEFTVSHLKQFITLLASCPELERIHLIAHSRGCDVTITALRELHIGFQAQGKSTQAELKLENLVLAAPDLDEDVFVQRFVGEKLLSAARRTTIYTSPGDRVIELSDIVFASKRRVGNLGPRDFRPEVRHLLAKMPNLQFVECKVSHFSTSHDYVFAHPAALSDLILVLRDGAAPGAQHGRPLREPVEGVWELTNDYLLPRATPANAPAKLDRPKVE
jgi:esterase/lipase superfamily enzyme